MTVGAPHRPVLRQRVDVMGSTAEVTLVGGTPDATTAAVARVQDLERRWSRFRPDSEVSRLNAHAGRPVPVSHETLLLVQLARQGWRRMAGRYDPTLLAAVRRAGYTADFARLPAVPQRLTGPADHDPRTCGRITIDEHAGTVELPRDCGFDPGGIGKGLAADLVTAELASGGIPGGCVNIGGDLRVWGRGPQDDRWLVAAAAWQAEAYALAALLSGPAGAHADLRRWRVDGLVVDDRGRVHASRRLRRRTMNPQTWWFVVRASGLVAYALLDVTVIVGLLLSTRPLGRRPPPDWLLDWHGFAGGLSLTFTALHLGSLLLDDYIAFGVLDLFLPFAATWRPVALAPGILAFYLAVAIQATSRVRHRVPAGWWHRVHLLSVPLFLVATAHLLLAGTDADHPLVLLTVGGLTATTLLLLWFRLPAPTGTARPVGDD